jgi:septal ring factor EnvC (AmiA/AmiB activator)
MFICFVTFEQTEVRTVRARNKERGAMNKALEERAAQRDTEVARLVEQMSSLKMQLASKENEVSGLQAQLIESRGHIAQLGKELEASKATFEFVHQQLEESRSRHVGSYTASTAPASTSMRAALDSMSRSDLASMQVLALLAF